VGARASAVAPADRVAPRDPPPPRAFRGTATTGESGFGLAFQVVRIHFGELSLMFRSLSIAVAALVIASGPAFAQVKIGLMVSATGPTTAIGTPQKNTGELLPTRIGLISVEYVQYDDGGDTTRGVQNAKKLLQEHNIDALIGPSTTPIALAILDLVAEAKVPLMATVGTSSVVEPMDAKRRWVFKTTQNDDLIAGALIKHMSKAGVKTIGFIGFNDPYGENWHKVFTPRAEKAGIRVIANERYSRTDQSVTGQSLKILAAKPDAVLIAAVGGPAVLPQATLRDQGYKGTIYQTHAVATDDFIKLGKDKVEGTILAAGPMLVIDEIPASNPTGRSRRRTSRPTRSSSASSPRPSVPTPGTAASCWNARFPSPRRPASPARRRSASRCATRSSSRRRSSAARACSTCRRPITTAWTSALACW
jgi:branched-chain amino acid transport system substrate-binding protein